jgi:hypothetical protein
LELSCLRNDQFRLAIPAAVLTAAAVAGYLTYLVCEPMATVETNQRLPPFNLTLSAADTTASTNVDKRPGGDEKAAIAYLEAAQAILRRAPSARASASEDELPITGRIPLPKKASHRTAMTEVGDPQCL